MDTRLSNKKQTETQVIENGIEYTVRENKYGKFWFSKTADTSFEFGIRHRVDNPAIEYSYGGQKKWFLNGELVYSDDYDNTCKFELTDIMIKQIIKYKLSR